MVPSVQHLSLRNPCKLIRHVLQKLFLQSCLNEFLLQLLQE